jgi:hypothetical protein
VFDITKAPTTAKPPISVTLDQAMHRWGANSVITILENMNGTGLFTIGTREYRLILEVELNA